MLLRENENLTARIVICMRSKAQLIFGDVEVPLRARLMANTLADRGAGG